MDSPTATIAVVTSRTEADLIVGLLRSRGLHAELAADDAGGQHPHLQMDGVKVLVLRSQEAAARQILAATDRRTGSDNAR